MRCYKQCVAARLGLPEYAESKETLGPMTIGGCQSKEYDIVFLEMGTNRYTGLDFIEYELNIVKP
ncbi:hypothetical protein MCOR02_011906 [Pyricularia oryzae]|nr:hypothetical protein MCOR02_011906 [Pyricularia oryzae]KAI6257152.1 hypothetical protein MCOR19_006410 [Pyricularia oryzae]KAI6403346.1 hypothetical protein MCOR20_007348 [Pyricularia oryzae]KAI6592665.1 hypothetical protein MCOR06_004093 [Pyricularia oryzae]